MDPFGEHTDDELWRALDRAHLSQVIKGHGSGMDLELHDGGAPWSAGQIQLLSLARAIVRDTKVSLSHDLLALPSLGSRS